MTKPQALLFGPVGLIFLLPGLKDRKALVRAGIGLGAALALMYFGSLPFAFYAAGFTGEAFTLLTPVTWLFKQLMGATEGYKYLTVNACNLRRAYLPAAQPPRGFHHRYPQR